MNVASSDRSGLDASPVEAPQPTIWKLNSCFDARPEYGPIGAVNWGRYSNVKVDYLIEQALQQVDDENRSIMLQEATKLAMSDLGIMPIHFQFTMWATKKNVQYAPRTDEYTLAFQFKPLDKMAASR